VEEEIPSTQNLDIVNSQIPPPMRITQPEEPTIMARMTQKGSVPQSQEEDVHKQVEEDPL